MHRLIVKPAFLFIGLLILSDLFTLAYSLEDFEVRYVEVTVYEDGSAHITYNVIVNETLPYITVKLLTSIHEFLIVASKKGEFLSYELNGDYLTVYTLGETGVVVEFDTNNLTQKNGEVWTIKFRTLYNSTIILPKGSTVIYVSDVPIDIATLNEETILKLNSGVWEISYILPSVPTPIVTQVTPTPSTTPTPPPNGKGFPTLEMILTAGLIIIVVAVLCWAMFRKDARAPP